MKKISIIMPVYNGKEFIGESIKSILNQTYKNFEFIIINEYGSNDGCKQIIEKYAERDNRIILIQNTKREGIAESLNIGIRNATGEYIARMDADDISLPKRLEVQYNYLEEHQDIGLCGIQPTFFGTQEMNWNVSLDSNFIKHAIFFYSPCVHPTIMFRKSIIEEHKIYYNKKYTASEDYDFLAKFAKVSLIDNINDPTLFKYRLHSSNATNTQNNIGLVNYSEIMDSLFKSELKLNFSKEEIELLNCHVSLNKFIGKELLENYIKLDILLKKILVASFYSSKYDVNMMFNVLKKRFYEAKNTLENKNDKEYGELINFYLSTSIFNYNDFSSEFIIEKVKNHHPKISVLLPVYNSEDYILDSLLSIIHQDFKDFEIIILYEYGIKDNTLKYINIINDSRIKIVKNDKKLGLAASLNEGIKIAKGKYIARMDSDDLSTTNRFKLQYELLEENPKIDICSSWQKHFGPDYIWIHKSPYEDEKIKALLLFECCICHSTVMFRREKFIKNNLFYRTDIRQEDYELWCRATDYCNFAIIQEILGYYRLHSSNITSQDLSTVSDSQTNIIKRNLQKIHVNCSNFRDEVYVGFEYLYDDIPGLKEEADNLFRIIQKNNKKYKVYDEEALNYAIEKRKKWINKEEEKEIKKPHQKNNYKYYIKKMLYPLYKKFKFRVIDISNDQIEKNLNNYYKIQNIENELNSLKSNEYVLKNRINELEAIISKQTSIIDKTIIEYNKYEKGDVIKAAFIMQAASFWPSFESIYNELLLDMRFDLKIFLIDEKEKEQSQFASCAEFLKNNNIDYEILTIAKLKKFNPHIAFIQTPYDKWHRSDEFSSINIKRLGIRLIYIPYGIEFAGTDESINLQFGTKFYENMWRIYTINTETKEKYCIYSNMRAEKIKVFGNPKFDGLHNKHCLTNIDFKTMANGRKIVLLKIHFPNIRREKDEVVLYSPNMNVYLDLLKNLNKFSNYFFIIMPHPKLKDYSYIDGVKELCDLLNEKNNNYFVFNEDDYRQPLYEADYFISDRSSIAIEMANFEKPILFLENDKNIEKFLPGFRKLFDAYEKGNSYKDIEKFLLNIEKDNSKKISFTAVYNEVVPYHDGKIGKRIVDDIYNTLNSDNINK